MSIVKSLSVGNGDMFYINHGSDNFTVIDCCMDESNKDTLVEEILKESEKKGCKRFISTHPDEDHIQGLDYLNEHWHILNFYCVQNQATKEDETESFKEYCKLRDSGAAYYVYKGCTRKWMNQTDNVRRSSGLSCLWPDTNNENFKEELKKANNGESPNNISLILQYNCGAKFLWMGDIETSFLEKVKDEINFKEIDVLFAPHHGRKSGKIPSDVLALLNPKIIVIGEASSTNLNYYSGYNTITQNSAGDITFEVTDSMVNVFVSNPNYEVDYLIDEQITTYENYIGSIIIE